MTRITLIRTALASAAAIALPFGVSAQTTGPTASPQMETPTTETASPSTSTSASRIPDSSSDAAADTATTTTPADTSTTATTSATTSTQAGAVSAATAADVTTGAEVRDQNGEVVGKIESVDASGAVISTGKSRVQIPVNSFGKNDGGLVLAMTKAQLDAAASQASPS